MMPVIDGHVIPASPGGVYKKGHAHNVPYILGINSHEGALFTLPVIRVLGITIQVRLVNMLIWRLIDFP